jgi:hypothetical protein
MTNFRTSSICGAVSVAVLANGSIVEACERQGATACPIAPEEMLHIHTEGPRGPGMPKPVYVFGTGTGGPTGPNYVLNADPASFKMVMGPVAGTAT